MASILDTNIVSLFSSVVVFLLVYSIVWGVLSWRKIMGNQQGVYAIIAFTIAFVVAVATPIRNFVLFIAPAYVALAVVIFFILFVVSIFGLSPEKDFPAIIKDSRARNWIVILVVLIFVAGLAFTFGPALTPGGAPGITPGGGPQAGDPGSTATANFGTNVMNTLFHPKVLGIIVVFTIAALAVYFLSETGGKH